jgi:DNA primase
VAVHGNNSCTRESDYIETLRVDIRSESLYIVIMKQTVKQHLHSRYFNTNLHAAWVDDAEGVATFPLWNLSGKLVGYQQYRPFGDKKKFNNPKDGKYFTYRKDKVVGVWGLESWNLSNTLFMTEGVFDACRLTARGFSAIAMLANDLDSSTKAWLRAVRSNRCVVAVCDNDTAGRRLAKHGTVAHVVETGDLGDASDEYVTNLAKEYS